MRLKLAFTLCLLSVSAFAQGSKALVDEAVVTVNNKSTPEVCAERDNVALEFVSPDVRHMEIQATHPSYTGMIHIDKWAPDFTACNMPGSGVGGALPRKTFYESPTLWLTGLTDPAFWRPSTVPIRVGDRVETGFAYIQLWMLYRERAEEILVLYPADGYWRIRPLPFGDMRWTSYGSSFLIGPVEVQDRPIVGIKDIVFDPEKKAFTLNFARGGSAVVAIKKVDQDHFALDVSYSDAMPDKLPFAAMRSMYVTESNADVSAVSWRSKGGAGWGESPVLSWKGGQVTELWAGRGTPSRHNQSAPDMIFSHFRP